MLRGDIVGLDLCADELDFTAAGAGFKMGNGSAGLKSDDDAFNDGDRDSC